VRSWGEGLTAWLATIRHALPAADLVWEFGRRFRERNGVVLVGYLAYRLFIWFVPLMLVLVAGIGFSSAANLDMVRYATEYGFSDEAARDGVSQAQRGRVAALVAGLLALAWATWGLIRGIHYAFAQVWAIKITPRRRVLREVVLVMVAALLVAALFAAVAGLQRQGPIFALLGTAGTIALAGVSLWAVCWLMPRRTDNWLDLFPGAALGALGVAALQAVIAIYLPARITNASELYGGIGVALGLLFYMFLISYLLVGTAFFNSVWADRARIIAGRPWVLDPAALPVWLRRPARWAHRAETSAAERAESGEDRNPPAGSP
jgi:uncharacterized BrkB/YihY/UPF0761 family membrane protein